MQRILASAFKDIGAGLRRWRVWVTLASEDIGDQHRRTTLGPLWLLVNYLAFAGTFVFVFDGGNSGNPNYLAYVATGLLVWFYMMETIVQSVSLFAKEESFIKGTTLPITTYVMRLTTQSVIRAGYALCGCLAILAFSDTTFSMVSLWALAGIAILLVTTPAVILVTAFIGAYFPDSQFIVGNVMRIGMFLTPVFWIHTSGTGGIRSVLYYWNPFTYFLEIVRIPIVAGEFPGRSFLFCLLFAAVMWSMAILLLGTLRKQLAFVL